MPQIRACGKESRTQLFLHSLVSASWHKSSGLPVIHGRSHNVLAGGSISGRTAGVTGAWGEREARGHKSVGNQAACVKSLVFCKWFLQNLTRHFIVQIRILFLGVSE